MFTKVHINNAYKMHTITAQTNAKLANKHKMKTKMHINTAYKHAYKE